MDTTRVKAIEAEIAQLSISEDASAKEQIHKLLWKLGHDYEDSLQLPEATDAYSRAVAVKPDCPDSRFLLAQTHFDAGDVSKAAECYLEALKICPTHMGALQNLAIVKFAQNKVEEAEQLCRKVIQTYSDCPTAHTLMATIKRRIKDDQKRSAAAEIDYEIGQIQQWKESDSFHDQTVQIISGSVNIPDLIRSIRADLKLNPDGTDTLGQLNVCLQVNCDWSDYEDRMKKLSDLIDKRLQLNLPPPVDPFVANYFFPLSLQQQLGIATHYAQLAIKKTSTPVIHCQLSAEKRLRIGYIYTVSKTFPLLKSHSQHNPERVEVFYYSFFSERAEILAAIPDAFDYPTIDGHHVIDLSTYTNSLQAANRIASDGIHILVNLNDYVDEGFALGAILSLRPAPIQAVYRNTLGSTGASYVDYFITDKVASPIRLAHGYTEKLAYMPNGMFVYAESRVPTKIPAYLKEKSQLRKRFGLPESAVVYGVMSKSFNIDPTTFQSWCEILRRVPGSVLWFFPHSDEMQINLRKEAKRLKINPHRLIFVTTDADGSMPKSSAKGKSPVRMGDLIDVVLDTPMCNAAGWMDFLCRGIPVATLPRESFPSRLTASLLTSMGCEELIAKSHLWYIEMNVNMGNQPELRQEMKDRMWENLPDSNLFRIDLFFNDLESLYEKMWKLKEMGKDPEHIE